MPAYAHLLLAFALASGGSSARVHADPEAIREVQREQEVAPPPASARAIAHYLEARRLLAEGDAEGAARSLRQAVLHDGASAELRLALAEALAAAGEQEAAMAEAERAVALARGGPIAVDASVLIAGLQAAAGEFEAAILAAHRAAQLAGAEADRRNAAPDPEPWLVLAELYAGTGDELAAERTLEELEARLPGAGGGWRELGRALLARGAVDAAERHLRRAMRMDGGDLEALRLLAVVHERQRRIDAAREDLLALLALDPGDAPALLALGRLALRDDEAAEARRWFDRYVGAAGDRTEARSQVALEWLEAHRPADALAVVRDGGGDDPRLRFAEGLALERLRRWNEAADALARVPPTAAELYPAARASLAWALARAGRHAEAERALAPAIAAFPGDVRLVTTRAYVLDRAGRSAEAIASLRRAIAATERGGDPGPPELHEALAEILARAGRAAEAVAGLRRAAAAAPRDERLAYALGLAYDRAGQGEAALAQMRALLALNPDHAEALNFVAYHYAERGVRLDEAETLARRALALRPRSGYVLDSLGWILYRRGEIGRAIELLEQADALAGPEATILEHLGDAYRAAARLSDAASAYRRALAQVGDQDPAQCARTRAALERKLRLVDTPTPHT